jgi:hypothetical protein
MPPLLLLAAALLAPAPAPAPAPAAPAARHAYAEGQVWEYRTRPGEEESRLKIQKIETPPEAAPPEPVYHISIIGLHLAPHIVGFLPHAPVSRRTLDASVTRLSGKPYEFPPVEPGIDEWRRAKGGVFTISVAEIVELLDRTTREAPQDQMPEPPQPSPAIATQRR